MVWLLNYKKDVEKACILIEFTVNQYHLQSLFYPYNNPLFVTVLSNLVPFMANLALTDNSRIAKYTVKMRIVKLWVWDVEIS